MPLNWQVYELDRATEEVSRANPSAEGPGPREFNCCGGSGALVHGNGMLLISEL